MRLRSRHTSPSQKDYSIPARPEYAQHAIYTVTVGQHHPVTITLAGDSCCGGILGQGGVRLGDSKVAHLGDAIVSCIGSSVPKGNCQVYAK